MNVVPNGALARRNLLSFIGKLLAAIPYEHGAKAEVARLLGVSPSYLSRLASGSLAEVSDEVAGRVWLRTGYDCGRNIMSFARPEQALAQIAKAREALDAAESAVCQIRVSRLLEPDPDP